MCGVFRRKGVRTLSSPKIAFWRHWVLEFRKVKIKTKHLHLFQTVVKMDYTQGLSTVVHVCNLRIGEAEARDHL